MLGEGIVPNAVTVYPSTKEATVLTPEVVDPRIADVEAIARWTDYAFRLPGGFRFGIGGIIGLIPGIGDILDAAISLYIVFRAIQLRIARVAIARMLLNVGIEALVPPSTCSTSVSLGLPLKVIGMLKMPPEPP